MSLYEYRPQDISLRLGDVFDMPPHLHTHIEILYLIDGELQLSVSRRRSPMTSGDTAVVFPNAVHSFQARSTGGALEILIFSPTVLRQNRNLLAQYRPRDPVVRAADLHPDVRSAMQSLQAEIPAPDERLCPILFDLIMARLIPALTLEKNAETNRFDVTAQAVAYMTHHFQEPLTLDSVAEKLEISRYRLSRLFTRELGISFSRYLRQLRVSRAKELLLSGGGSVLDIGMDCGFGTLRSFERAFAEDCGVTPRDYRRHG
ncbi:MAG: AraC family transcriptional regulator [Oscillospiraceae bacterium]|nr:AraC family transcriptional regulator [Oscillospiraceae bacterium]